LYSSEFEAILTAFHYEDSSVLTAEERKRKIKMILSGL